MTDARGEGREWRKASARSLPLPAEPPVGDDPTGGTAAGDLSYVYLAAGQEGVILVGPSVANAEGLLTPVSPAITMIGVRSTSADGYDVVGGRHRLRR